MANHHLEANNHIINLLRLGLKMMLRSMRNRLSALQNNMYMIDNDLVPQFQHLLSIMCSLDDKRITDLLQELINEIGQKKKIFSEENCFNSLIDHILSIPNTSESQCRGKCCDLIFNIYNLSKDNKGKIFCDPYHFFCIIQGQGSNVSNQCEDIKSIISFYEKKTKFVFPDNKPLIDVYCTYFLNEDIDDILLNFFYSSFNSENCENIFNDPEKEKVKALAKKLEYKVTPDNQHEYVLFFDAVFSHIPDYGTISRPTIPKEISIDYISFERHFIEKISSFKKHVKKLLINKKTKIDYCILKENDAFKFVRIVARAIELDPNFWKEISGYLNDIMTYFWKDPRLIPDMISILDSISAADEKPKFINKYLMNIRHYCELIDIKDKKLKKLCMEKLINTENKYVDENYFFDLEEITTIQFTNNVLLDYPKKYITDDQDCIRVNYIQNQKEKIILTNDDQLVYKPFNCHLGSINDEIINKGDTVTQLQSEMEKYTYKFTVQSDNEMSVSICARALKFQGYSAFKFESDGRQYGYENTLNDIVNDYIVNHGELPQYINLTISDEKELPGLKYVPPLREKIPKIIKMAMKNQTDLQTYEAMVKNPEKYSLETRMKMLRDVSFYKYNIKGDKNKLGFRSNCYKVIGKEAILTIANHSLLMEMLDESSSFGSGVLKTRLAQFSMEVFPSDNEEIWINLDDVLFPSPLAPDDLLKALGVYLAVILKWELVTQINFGESFFSMLLGEDIDPFSDILDIERTREKNKDPVANYYMDMDFLLPSTRKLEFKVIGCKDDVEVTNDNYRLFEERIYHFLAGDFMKTKFDMIRAGMSEVMNLDGLKLISASELMYTICGDCVKLDEEFISTRLEFKEDEENNKSKVEKSKEEIEKNKEEMERDKKNFISALQMMNEYEFKKFLTFVAGSWKLKKGDKINVIFSKKEEDMDRIKATVCKTLIVLPQGISDVEYYESMKGVFNAGVERFNTV